MTLVTKVFIIVILILQNTSSVLFPLRHSWSCRSNVQIMNNKNHQNLSSSRLQPPHTASHSYLGHNTPLVGLGKLHSIQLPASEDSSGEDHHHKELKITHHHEPD